MTRRSLKANTLIVMAGTLGSRLSGVLRQGLMNTFGDTVLDAFLVASRVPNLLRELLAEGALVNAFIPVYKGLNPEEQRRFAAAFSGLLIAVNLLLVALGIFAAPLLVSLLTASGSNVDTELATGMTRLVMPFLMLISLSAIAMGLLNAGEHFKQSSFAPVAFNLASIAVLAVALLSGQTAAATWLGVSWVVGGFAQLAVQLPALMRLGILPRPRLGAHPALSRTLRLMAPFTLTAGSRQLLNLVVTRLLSNGALFPAGTVAGYANAEVLFTMANGLFVVSPALALFPRFAQHAAEEAWEAFTALTAQALRTVTFLAAPVSALLIALAPHALSIFNFRGDFSADRFAAGTVILSFWALALLPWAVNTILIRTFYARQLTFQAVLVSASAFVVEVGLYLLLTPRIGLAGFGLSTALVGLAVAAALLALYRRDLNLPLRPLAGHLARVLALALLAGAAVWTLRPLLPEPGPLLTGVLGLGIGGALGMAVYLGGAALLGMPELAGVTRRLRRR